MGLWDALYRVVMRRNAVYVTFVVVGAFAGERAVDYGVHKLWDMNNIGDGKLLKEAKKLSWDEQLQHKNWKVRNDANIDLAALRDSITDPKDARLREFGPLFKKTAADSKAPVLGKALDTLLAFQRAADADAARCVST